MEEHAELLRKAFPELTDSLLAELAQKVRKCTYPIGSVLCQEGKVEDTFYIICSGHTAVSKLLDGETSRILTYQGPGEFFGELGLIQGGQRVATVVTLEETTVLELNKTDFLNFLENSPSMVVTIMRAVASRLRDADQRSIAELRRKNKELGQAYRKLEAETQQRSRWLTTVAHELRAPLATVKSRVHQIDAGALGPADMDSAIETVAENVDSIVQLVNNILFLQELDLIEPQFQPVAIDDIVRQTAADIEPNAQRAGLAVRVSIAPDLGPIMGDAASLKQALAALLDNALKFSARGGEITVRVQPQDSAIEITVSDTGAGIPPERIPHLFDWEHRSAPDAQLPDKIGLGLPIAKSVVEQHHGSLRVDSQPGQGSTFTICLPVAPATKIMLMRGGC